MLHTKVLLISKNENVLKVRECSTGNCSTIPVVRLKGFQFYADYVDETDHLPKVGGEYPAVMKEDGTIYLDRFNSEYWTYSTESVQQTENNWLQIIRRLLELSQIGSLTPELTQEMLELYHKKQYGLLEEKLIKECRLFDYVWSDESQFLEHKSSLIYPAGFQKGDLLTVELKNKQLDVLSETLVGAANARQEKDFHLEIGVTDDKQLTSNVNEEIEKYFDGNVQQFIDMFTNRLNQLVRNIQFTSSLRFEVITVQGKKILDVVVPQWKGDVLFYKDNVYVRTQATTTLLEGMALVNYIRSL